VDIAAFRASPVGSLHSIRGEDEYLKRSYEHYAFVPHPLPSSVPLEQATYQALSIADREVGRLDAAAERLPNPQLLVRPALISEAVSTSALEGTHAPLLEVLEADFIDERRRSYEVHEILNYVRAAGVALERIKELPVCFRLLAELQQILVQGTRGDRYDAGRLRDQQVYIGERRAGMERSRFVPPPPGDVLKDGISEWEKWVNAEDSIPLLVKAALGHYQFETLHPFSDGNGRLGRLAIVLQLIEGGALRYPILNLSPWIEPRKEQYKDLLLQCSLTGQFDEWIRFFAQAVQHQAQEAVSRIEMLTNLRAVMIEALRQDKAKGVVLDVVEDLIAWPVITVSQAAAMHNVTYPPANSAIQRLVRLGFLEEMTGRSYGRVYACPGVMRAVEQELPPSSTIDPLTQATA
jgi:Fic family protein